MSLMGCQKTPFSKTTSVNLQLQVEIYIRKFKTYITITKRDTYYFRFHTYNNFVDGYGGYVGAAMNIDDKSYFFRRSSAGHVASRTPGLNWAVDSVHEIEFFIYFDSYAAYGGSAWSLTWTTDTFDGVLTNTNGDTIYPISTHGNYQDTLEGVTGWSYIVISNTNYYDSHERNIL